jgi:hypothetical protein
MRRGADTGNLPESVGVEFRKLTRCELGGHKIAFIFDSS